MITVKNIGPQKAEHFFNGKSLGQLDWLQHLDLRCQIKRLGATGYSLSHNGKIISIQTDGGLNYPNDLYTQSTEMLNFLFDI